jgi:hypothetical protein
MRSRNGRGPVKHEHPVAVLDPATQFQGGGRCTEPVARGGVIRDEPVRELPCGFGSCGTRDQDQESSCRVLP